MGSRSRRNLLIAGLLTAGPLASASDFRLGVGLGYGGEGIVDNGTYSPITVQGSGTATAGTGTTATTPSTVARSEGPGMFRIFIDYPLSDRYSIALEHSRGFRLGPFSSGVSFTGMSWRWYWRGDLPAMPKIPPGESSVLVKRFIPFLGLAGGVAAGTISRDNDQIPSISSAGVYIGWRLGADYQYAPGVVLRPELVYSTSLSAPNPLTEFSLGCSVLFDL